MGDRDRGDGVSVRVRFAPEPDRMAARRRARTAYFNWLFARQHSGAFVIRIEDTDVERSSGASETGVLDDLRWLGLDHDEGPDVGGPYGPYRQSERLPLYRERVGRLLELGAAYPCFCTDAELDAAPQGGARRRDAAALRRPLPDPDRGRARGASAARAGPRAFASRSRRASGRSTTRCAARCASRPAWSGDFVLLRSSGLPTYNFAVRGRRRGDAHHPRDPRRGAPRRTRRASSCSTRRSARRRRGSPTCR